VAPGASSNTSKQMEPGGGAFPCRTGSGRGMDMGGGRRAGHCLSAPQGNCCLEIKHPASRGRDGH